MKYELGEFDAKAYEHGRGVVDEMRRVMGAHHGIAHFVLVAVYVNGYLQFVGADACISPKVDRLAAKQQAALILGRMNPDGDIDRKARLADNAQQIDNTDYYRLPCGRYLEDFVSHWELDFAEGSALKYLWRAGRKDGESRKKDLAKAEHYLRFIVDRHDRGDMASVRAHFATMIKCARAWDGKEAQR